MDIRSELKRAQLEHFETASIPSPGVKNRIIIDSDTSTILLDTGTGWKTVSTSTLGDIKQSFLTKTQFLVENGPTWVLADGTSINGSDYSILTGQVNAPDCRGLFLRTANEGRTGALSDPDNTLLGASVGDKTAPNGLAVQNDSHSHTYERLRNIPGGNILPGGTAMVTDFPSTSSDTHNHGLTGDNETSPKFIAVNTFIKINR